MNVIVAFLVSVAIVSLYRITLVPAGVLVVVLKKDDLPVVPIAFLLLVFVLNEEVLLLLTDVPAFVFAEDAVFVFVLLFPVLLFVLFVLFALFPVDLVNPDNPDE